MDLTISRNNLPQTVEDLHRFIIIGKERLNAHKAKIRAIEKIETAHSAKAAALTDAQDVADILLDAEAKLGEMLAAIEPKYIQVSSMTGTNLKPVAKQKSLPPEITKKESHVAQTIARNPGVVEKVKFESRETGTIPTAQDVYKEIQREKQKELHTAIKQNEIEPIQGLYDVIVIDPPWPVKKIEREVRPNQVEALDYPVMEIDEIIGLEIPAKDNCHIFLWTTHKFLPSAFEIIQAWGLKYIFTFVWHKPGGFQPYGLPQYNCEFCLYARKGSPEFIDTKNFFTCFEAPRGKHSEKPEFFYETVHRVTSGERIDIFSRRRKHGFDGWGLEAI